VFSWSIYNGSTYYIDVFGKRFQKELEEMKAEVLKWQSMADLEQHPPLVSAHADEATGAAGAHEEGMAVATSAASLNNDRLATRTEGQVSVPRADGAVTHPDETKGA